MYKDKMILVVVPARGGSKRIPKKNLKIVANKSLIQIVAECVRSSRYIDETLLSSDDEKIISEGEKYGLKKYSKRPKILSGDNVGDIPVLVHSLKKAEKINNCFYDIIIMLQPTSPLRKPRDIENLIEKIVNEKFDTVWTIHMVEKQFHPDKQLKLNSRGYLEYFTEKGKEIVINQELTDSYMKNGIGYAITRKYLLEKKLLLGEKSGFVLHSGPIINIDTEDDLKFADLLLKKTFKTQNSIT